jgi:anaerobic selenocysteine-containing dehydrogenase
MFALHNVANYSAPVLPLEPGDIDEWEILARLALIAAGVGPAADPDLVTDLAARTLLHAAVADDHGPVAGRDVDELFDELAGRRGPEKLLDLMLRTGPYGDGFGANPDGLTLAKLEAQPHGIDFGPLMPRIPDVLRTPSGKIELAPEPLVADVARLRADLTAAGDGMVLIGRRDLRSNNSWMHNAPVLVKGKVRCTMLVHPDDAARLGLADGRLARVRSRAGQIDVPVEVSDVMRRGVVSIPHGWGHDLPGIQIGVASAHAGVSCNRLVDEQEIDPLSGNAVLNGVPVSVEAI